MTTTETVQTDYYETRKTMLNMLSTITSIGNSFCVQEQNMLTCISRQHLNETETDGTVTIQESADELFIRFIK